MSGGLVQIMARLGTMLSITWLSCMPGLVFAQQWLAVETLDRPITVSASGIVASADALRFGPPPSRSWRITITQLAREGSRVEAGAILAKFDASATDDRVRALSAELNEKSTQMESLMESQAREQEEGKVRLASARSEAEKASRKAETDAKLYASLEYRKLLEESAMAAEVYRREQQRVVLVERVRQSKRDELEAEIRRIESELQGAQRELESFTVRATRAGLVIIGTNREGQKLDINDSVNPGLVVVELVDENKLVVHAEVPEYAAASIAPGQSVKISIEAAGGSEVEGQVVEVASIFRRQSQFSQGMVRDVTVSLPAAIMQELRSGMSAKLDIVVGTRRNALAVPDQAIHYRAGKPGVMVRGDGWVPVILGEASAGFHVVEEGLKAGAEVRL